MSEKLLYIVIYKKNVHIKAIGSVFGYLILGLKEFTTAVKSSTRLWSRPNQGIWTPLLYIPWAYLLQNRSKYKS